MLMTSLFLLFYTLAIISITALILRVYDKRSILKRMEKLMSEFLDKFHDLLEKVSAGSGTSPEDKQVIADLKQHLIENDATDAEQSTAITELTEKLGTATVPPTPAP